MIRLSTAVLLAGCTHGPLATVPDARRLSALATGELLVGSSDGSLAAVDGFGGVVPISAPLGAPVVQVAGDPLGGWWVLLEDRRLFQGVAGGEPSLHASEVVGMLRTCTELEYEKEGNRVAWSESISTIALGTSCDRRLVATTDGRIESMQVTDTAIVRLLPLDEGVLWVDASRRTGCEGCTSPVPMRGVLDVAFTPGAPFLEGELAWIDTDGHLWVR